MGTQHQPSHCATSLKNVILLCCRYVITHLQLFREWCNEPNGTLHVPHVADRGQQVGHLDLVRVLGLVVHEHHEAGRAHGVADIMELILPCLFQDVVDHGGDVVLAILIPPEGMYLSVVMIPHVFL